MVATQNFNNLREETKSILMLSYLDDNTKYITQKIEEELGDIHKSLCEAKLLLTSDM
ncbi:kinesin-like protein KIN-12G [Iris pallida]|uniref:Kinesin-like protein KIN-12G n=1 Tax=Iris pallida TaxID=29817 RepID=A0AAX6F5X1_IRIPA|nr:kinesin-like protein KIN-12G [Iris pallida]